MTKESKCMCGRTTFIDDYSEMQKCSVCHCVVLSQEQIQAMIRQNEVDTEWLDFFAEYRTEKHDVGFNQKPMEH